MGARFSAPVQTDRGAHPSSCTMGTGSFPGVKSGWGVTLPFTPCQCRGHERVELYLYSPYRPYGLYRASVPVQGWPLPLLYFSCSIRMVSLKMTSNRATCEEKLNNKCVYDQRNCVRCWLNCLVNFVTLNTASHLYKFTSPAPSISRHEHAGSCIVPAHTRFLPFGFERKPMSMLCRMTSIVHLSHNAGIISFFFLSYRKMAYYC